MYLCANDSFHSSSPIHGVIFVVRCIGRFQSREFRYSLQKSSDAFDGPSGASMNGSFILMSGFFSILLLHVSPVLVAMPRFPFFVIIETKFFCKNKLAFHVNLIGINMIWNKNSKCPLNNTYHIS